MMKSIIQGFVAAILQFVKELFREPTKATDADDTSDLRDRLRDRVRRAEGRDGPDDGSAPLGP